MDSMRLRNGTRHDIKTTLQHNYQTEQNPVTYQSNMRQVQTIDYNVGTSSKGQRGANQQSIFEDVNRNYNKMTLEEPNRLPPKSKMRT